MDSDDQNYPRALQEHIGWRGALAFLAGFFLFCGVALLLFGDSFAGFFACGILPSLVWLGLLYLVLDEDGNYSPPGFGDN
jgi:hypothetical protein